MYAVAVAVHRASTVAMARRFSICSLSMAACVAALSGVGMGVGRRVGVGMVGLGVGAGVGLGEASLEPWHLSTTTATAQASNTRHTEPRMTMALAGNSYLPLKSTDRAGAMSTIGEGKCKIEASL